MTSCPICGAAGVPVLYGLPEARAAKAEREGRVALGGCLLFDDLPMWQCTGPGRHQWSEGDEQLWRREADAAIHCGDGGTAGDVQAPDLDHR